MSALAQHGGIAVGYASSVTISGDVSFPDLGTQLRAYLAAAARAAREHPYPGVIPGVIPPELTAVYVRQQARPFTASLGKRRAPAAQTARQYVSLPAKTLLKGDDHRIVVAGPGGGKTSLLRRLLVAVAEERPANGDKGGHHSKARGRRRNSRESRRYPVLVPAAALTREMPLAEALATHLNAELPDFGLSVALSPKLFAMPPAPRAHWDVFVDGLDEIQEPEARKRVLGKLRNATPGPSGDILYRFIVTTRPLVKSELAQLGSEVRSFELQPFESRDLPRFTREWFRALGVRNPGQASKLFLSGLESSGLAELARVPLMATMLCQLHAAGEGWDETLCRGEIYRRFVALLHKRQHSKGPSGIREQTRTALARWGVEAMNQAEQVLDHLPVLIGRLATATFAGGTDASVLDQIAGQPEAIRPQAVPEAEWRDFLTEALRRSGLLTERAGDFVFLHQTLLEYLAAQHDPDPEATLLRHLAEPWGRLGPLSIARELGQAWLDGKPARPWHWGRMVWNDLINKPSYVGFLIDLVVSSGATTAAAEFRRMADRGGVLAWRSIVDQAQMGTDLPQVIVEAATQGLKAFVSDPRADDSGRSMVATQLARAGFPWAHESLASIAANAEVDGLVRVWAATALHGMGDVRGLLCLKQVAVGAVTDRLVTLYAAGAAAGIGEEWGTEILAHMASDDTVPFKLQKLSARVLAEAGDVRAPRALKALEVDPRGRLSWRQRKLKEWETQWERDMDNRLPAHILDPGTSAKSKRVPERDRT
ncbi:NACHT domain-containing NTPase [Streptomyces sp. M-16]|uniref:NACHT domain-containing protein n=1 Tax=Streptomyces sp. M-16 TaxID=3233040 RepID=UPI003F9C30DC